MPTERRTLNLKVLKSDIENTDYYDPKDCAITRALKRVDFDGVTFSVGIVHTPTNSLTELPKWILNKVVGMYATAHNWEESRVGEIRKLPLEDFEFAIEVILHWP